MTREQAERFQEIADTGQVRVRLETRDSLASFTLSEADAAAIKAARQRLRECEGILKAIGLHPDKIKESIRQMDEGKGIPMEDVVAESRREYPKEWAEADELASLRSRLAAAEQRIRDLLMSADAAWEEHNMGHDWREACEAARELLNEKVEKPCQQDHA